VRRLATLLAVVFAFSILANAKKFPFIAAPNVPGARGQVEFKTDNSGNNHVKLKVEHLASPQNLTPPKNSYVIWFEEPNGYPTIEGVLRTKGR
jgi:hypothetical protein